MPTTIETHISIALFMDGLIPLFSTGNFTFSDLFHSYKNPQHLCGECVEKGSVCCDTVDQADKGSTLWRVKSVILSSLFLKSCTMDFEERYIWDG